jgi:hypothetical protein
VVEVEHHHVALGMTGEADAQRWRPHQRHCQALQIRAGGLQSVVVRTRNDVEGINVRFGGDLPLNSIPAASGEPRASSGMSGECHPDGLSQPIFGNAAREPEFQVNAPRFGG